jgi:L-ascorbate metabolism protein UlaG (beta-lactamase superfamily)
MAERSPFADVLASDDETLRVIAEHLRTATGSWRDGGPLAYLIETPYGTIFYQDTSGCWTGVMRDLRADAAILALSGRPQVDGEPHQGSMAGFVAMESRFLQPRQIVLAHHDNWLGHPSFNPTDLEPVRRELTAAVPGVALIEDGYLASTPLLA